MNENQEKLVPFIPRRDPYTLCSNGDADAFFEKYHHVIYKSGLQDQSRFWPSTILGEVHGYTGA